MNISGRIRQVHGEATEIKIMYEDQAYNDFNSLFLMLGGKIDWRIRVQTNLVISYRPRITVTVIKTIHEIVNTLVQYYGGQMPFWIFMREWCIPLDIWGRF